MIDLITNPTYKHDISPKGVGHILNLINELINNDSRQLLKKTMREHFLKQMNSFMKNKQLLSIQNWPAYKREEGVTITQNILINALKFIKLATEANVITEELIKTDLLTNIKNSFEYLNEDSYKLPVSIIYNIVNGRSGADDIVHNICSDYFTDYHNLKFIDTFHLLKNYQNKEMIIELLIFLSTLCRQSQNVYKPIHDLNIYNDLIALMESSDSSVKSRVCNLIGNMCRHTDFFYDEIKYRGLISPLLKCCYDVDKNTRKFACFAIGNAAFLNNKLYDQVRPIIPRMVELLQDPETNTRANSAGALGNFARCDDSLCYDIIQNKAHESLLKLAETEEIPGQIQTIKVALFALGNFCYHQAIKVEFDNINFRQRIEDLRGKFGNIKELLEHIDRIKKKL